MKKRITNKSNWQILRSYEVQFRKQKAFPALPKSYNNRIQPIMHVGYLMFIRSKFLYLALIKSMEEKNLYAAYSLLKSYWENVAAFGYYYIKISQLIKDNKVEDAFLLAKKMGLGGRGFVTEEMVKKKNQKIEDYTLCNILTMMDTVDKDFKRQLGKDMALFRDFYDREIAEGGHTTYVGLIIAGKWLRDGSLLPDVKKSWRMLDYGSILNFIATSSIVFYYYWDKFLKLKS